MSVQFLRDVWSQEGLHRNPVVRLWQFRLYIVFLTSVGFSFVLHTLLRLLGVREVDNARVESAAIVMTAVFYTQLALAVPLGLVYFWMHLR